MYSDMDKYSTWLSTISVWIRVPRADDLSSMQGKEIMLCVRGSQTHRSNGETKENRYGISTTKTHHRSMRYKPTLQIPNQSTHGPDQFRHKTPSLADSTLYHTGFKPHPNLHLPCPKALLLHNRRDWDSSVSPSSNQSGLLLHRSLASI